MIQVPCGCPKEQKALPVPRQWRVRDRKWGRPTIFVKKGTNDTDGTYARVQRRDEAAFPEDE
jgi:hypothetical protein